MKLAISTTSMFKHRIEIKLIVIIQLNHAIHDLIYDKFSRSLSKFYRGKVRVGVGREI